MSEKTPTDEKLEAVQAAVVDAVNTILSSPEPGKFAQALRLCAMGQKISVELVSSVKGARQVRTGYGGMVNDVDLIVDPNFVGAPGYDMALPNYAGVGMVGADGNDQVTMMRDLTMMLQSHFKGEADRKSKPKKETRYDVYLELNEALVARTHLQGDDASAPLLAKLNIQIEQLVDRVAQGVASDEPQSSVVPAELLRGHPPGAGLEPGNPFGLGGPVLHREDRCEIALEGGCQNGDHQGALG